MSKSIFNTAQFHACVDSADKLDYAQAEVAFAGRSNVGKSSLVNALCGRRLLAKISKTPGKTRTINVFSIRYGKWIVDLPGYGFAAVSIREKDSWKHMIECYLSSRSSLKAIFVLVDAHVGATALDRQMLAWLKSTGMPYRVIVNKIDRITQVKLVEQRQNLSLDLEVMPERILWVSAKKGTGIEGLQVVTSSFLAL
ncbi:MAG TPA: YihA family ribosome biogenesis GTP-binding protein [Candidatus Omnitrophica bacterium]|nr:YihA family ribosome biogenesis GTP-binding protein [Candidatus Omnitrophota bacterium]